MHRILFLFVVLVVSATTTASARTWLIKPDGTGDAPNIAAGVDSCMPGDTLLLDSGTFTGPGNRQITVDKSVEIQYHGSSTATIDGQRSGMAFDFVGAQNSRLQNVTIAFAWTVFGEDFPISVRSGASLVVSDCVFRDNRGARIGAIHCDGESALDVSDSVFRNNFGVTGAGAISGTGVVTNIRNCWFESNGSNGGTGALHVLNPDLPSVIEGNTFWNNSGHQIGAAIGMSAVQPPQVLTCRNNTIVGNSGDVQFSGAIYVNGEYMVIENNIIAFNNLRAFYCNSFNDNSSLVQCNVLFDNAGDNSLCLDFVGSGNVVADPVFCDAANGNFRIDATSPAAPWNNTCSVLLGASPLGCGGSGIDGDAPHVDYALLGNAPNPFNPETVIRYSVPHAGAVTLEIFDVAGALVRTFESEHSSDGVKQLVWDGRDDRGRLVSSGVYVYRMTAPGFTESRKMLLLK